jgi:hypothetical protein
MERASKIKILKGLMDELYLSTACAAGNHLECRLVDKFRGLVCCCPDCDHEGRSPKKQLLTGPLLHSANTIAEQRSGYIYRGGLGRRVDLLRLATRVMLDARKEPRAPVLFEIADQIALLYAPRLG